MCVSREREKFDHVFQYSSSAKRKVGMGADGGGTNENKLEV